MGLLQQYKNGIIIVLTMLALVVGSYYLGGVRHDDSKYQQQIAQWQDIAHTALLRNAVVNHTVDSLNNVVKANTQLATVQTDSIQRLRARADSIRKARTEVTQVLSQLPDTCAPAKVVIMNQNDEIVVLQLQAEAMERRDTTRLETIALLQKGLFQVRAQNDSLQRVIVKVPIYHEPKILGFIPQPSRTFSFIGGILVGVGTVVVLSHQVK